MPLYHEIIKEIKKNKTENFIKFEFNGQIISLSVIDDSDETVQLCLDWRNMFWQGYDTKFNGTIQRTRKWIVEQILNNPERIVFMILVNEQKIGHFGITTYTKEDNSVWFESGIRGVRKSLPGLMEAVERKLIMWLFDDVKLSKIKLRLFSDNVKPINLHERCGFITIDSIPIKRIFTEEGWTWDIKKIESDEEFGERYYNIMELTKEYWEKKVK